MSNVKFNNILAFGDSFIAGCELGSDSPFDILSEDGKTVNTIDTKFIDKMDSITKPLSFGNLLASRLKIPCFNYGRSGASNERSLRKLISIVPDHKNSFIIFGITHYMRTEIYLPERKDKHLQIDSDNFLQIYPHDESNIVKNFWRHWRQEPYNNNKEIIISADAIAKYYGHKIIFINFFRDNELGISLPNIFDWEGINDYATWVNENKLGFTKHGHLSQEGHIRLSLILEKIINE